MTKFFQFYNTKIIFFWVLGFYCISFIFGYILSKSKSVSILTLSKIGRKFADSVSSKLHKRSRKYKKEAIKNGQWSLLFVLIFLNNFILVALITRILYGVIIFIPILLTMWEGFGHGTIFAKSEGRAEFILILFEFGGYLMATTVGVKIGIDLLTAILNSEKIVINLPWEYFKTMIFFLIMGAFIESYSIKSADGKNELKDIDKMDFTKQKENLAKKLDEEE